MSKKTPHNRIKRNNSGTTMVEILVAFVILVMATGAFYGMIKFSTNMLMRSTENFERISEYKQQFYTKDKSGLTKTDITGTFNLTVNTTRTNAANNATAATVCLTHMKVVKYTGDPADEYMSRLRVDAYEYD